MKTRIKCPAKINLNLKVFKKRPDGFHPIESVMQSVSLFDYLDIKLTEKHHGIRLLGNSDAIPYDEKNIVYRAVELFSPKRGVEIFIEKNIPISAGLAGGSTNAAGAIYGLNLLLGEPYSRRELHKMCAVLGSDLNFCLEGGRKLCTGRGETLTEQEFKELPVTIVKPKHLGISAKEAYERFDECISQIKIEEGQSPVRSRSGIANTGANDLEFALLPHYKELQELHNLGFQMSGSGPSFFILEEKIPTNLDLDGKDFEIFAGLKAINHGVCEE